MFSTPAIESLRALKSSHRENQRDNNPLIRKAVESYQESLKEVVEESRVDEAPKKTSKSGVLTFRLSDIHKARFDLLVGRSIAKKIINLMDYKADVDKVLAEQVRTLKVYANQFKDKNLLSGSISDEEFEKIITASKTITYIAHAINFTHSVHGRFMTKDEIEKIEAIIRFGKRFNN